MCIVIDANCLPDLFDKQAKEFGELEPVHDWLMSGKGKLVLGGSRYQREMQRVKKVLGVLAELSRKRKIVSADREKVDSLERQLLKATKNADFDDAHLVAIVTVSGCQLVCTRDKRAMPFLRRKGLYPKGGSVEFQVG